MLITFALAFVAVGGLSFLIGRSVLEGDRDDDPVHEAASLGDATVKIPSVGRKDEIGEMADAVQVFKTNTENERMRAEQAETEQRQAEQRKADMNRLADQFEAAIGEIVEAVSSASTELEASADTLTHTAERSQQLATRAARCIEEASAMCSPSHQPPKSCRPR